ncbi:MAG: molybdate ABC transporter substrate-binding protein [Rickettsiales bacterium]
MADASLTVPLTQIARAYAKEKDVQVATIFGSSKSHIAAIEAGDDANVFIAAKPSWIKDLQNKGLTDAYSRIAIAGNALAWVSSSKKSAPIALSAKMKGLSFLDDYGDTMCFFGDPEYLAEGTYALETLTSLNLMSEMEPCFSFLQDHADMIRSIVRYDGYSFIFSSDANLFPGIKSITPVKENLHAPIQYQAVVVAGEDMPAGREFLKYLQGPTAQGIFKANHFTVPNPS